MRSTSQRPSVRKYNSLNCRKTVAGEMARSVRTSSPDVSREQARYRRIMELNSAGALETGVLDSKSLVSHVGSASATSYPTDRGYRRSPQTWPRKLDPLPGRVNGFHQLPPSPAEKSDEEITFKLPDTSGSNESNNFNELSPSALDITTSDASSIENDISHHIDKDPWGINAATIAALAPISLPTRDEDEHQQNTDESLVTTTTIHSPQKDIKNRRRKKLLPIAQDESK